MKIKRLLVRYRRAIRRAIEMPRRVKRLIVQISDLIALPACLVAGSWLVMPGPVDWSRMLVPSGIVLFAGVFAMSAFGFYRSVVRFMGLELLFAAARSVTIAAVPLLLYALLAESAALGPRQVGAFWLLGMFYVIGSRAVARSLLVSGGRLGHRVLIYGAGEAGMQLAGALSARGAFSIAAFVDDDPGRHRTVINGHPVYSSIALPQLVEEYSVERVLLAVPSISRRQRQLIIERLEPLPVRVQIMPDLRDLVQGRASIDDIRDVEIDDLLGRDEVEPIEGLLGRQITGRSVIVTGAGGSIGSELSRQILRQQPKVLVLLEMSEPALYAIDSQLQELRREMASDTQIVPLLGSVLDEARMRAVLRSYKVDTLYHAAAYKHVPLVEHNMLEGVRNNVFGTWHAARAAIETGVQSFVLVSTDKAVKPTNVMGATKRFAELILQALDQGDSVTNFCMVRFGNVLASSGSVVPRFQEQIRGGGPVTVTHRDIYRYFMTIAEAASLVIQAGSMARGGEVFVLDMGEPVKIVDLARKMVRLMGLSVRDEDDPDGDIEIQFTGLRPGEKLYEELLIGDDVSGTQHARILRAREQSFTWETLEPMLDGLRRACEQYDCEAARTILTASVTGYSPAKSVEDLVWNRRNGKTGSGKPAPAPNVTRLEPRRDPRS